jgi:hypothetical protein
MIVGLDYGGAANEWRKLFVHYSRAAPDNSCPSGLKSDNAVDDERYRGLILRPTNVQPTMRARLAAARWSRASARC